jgi:hypothetical protein
VRATGALDLYGTPTVKRYRTFIATCRPAAGAIRVVLLALASTVARFGHIARGDLGSIDFGMADRSR